jgi:hypothetical protein
VAFDDLVAAIDRATQEILGGASVVYSPSAGADVTPTGMFDDNYTPIDGSESSYGGSIPSIVLRFEDLPEDPRENRPAGIQISGVDYAMYGFETDGVQGGSIRLFLREKP